MNTDTVRNKNKKTTLNRSRILEKCWRLETLADEMYTYLSRLHKGDSSISRLWKKMAKEEEDHAIQIRHLMKWKEGLVEEIEVEGSKLDRVIENLEITFRNMKRNPPTIEEALTEAVSLEEEFSEFHLENEIKFPNEEHRNMFQWLRKADESHVKSLKKALEKLKEG